MRLNRLELLTVPLTIDRYQCFIKINHRVTDGMIPIGVVLFPLVGLVQEFQSQELPVVAVQDLSNVYVLV